MKKIIIISALLLGAIMANAQSSYPMRYDTIKMLRDSLSVLKANGGRIELGWPDLVFPTSNTLRTKNGLVVTRVSSTQPSQIVLVSEGGTLANPKAKLPGNAVGGIVWQVRVADPPINPIGIASWNFTAGTQFSNLNYDVIAKFGVVPGGGTSAAATNIAIYKKHMVLGPNIVGSPIPVAGTPFLTLPGAGVQADTIKVNGYKISLRRDTAIMWDPTLGIIKIPIATYTTDVLNPAIDNRMFAKRTVLAPGNGMAIDTATTLGLFTATIRMLTALPNGTTATTQAANDNSTKVSTTSYTNSAVNAGPTGGRIGTATLVAGTVAISITGITTSSKAFVTRTVASNTTLTTGITAVCTAGTLTITADVAAGTINTADTSTYNYQVIN